MRRLDADANREKRCKVATVAWPVVAWTPHLGHCALHEVRISPYTH
jgi:hypothetical protein